MASYVVEMFVPRGRAAEVDSTAARARSAAIASRTARFVRAIYLAEDEICLFVFEAASAEVVGDVSNRAGILAERIVEAVEAPATKGGRG